jgi:hypothetical protein
MVVKIRVASVGKGGAGEKPFEGFAPATPTPSRPEIRDTNLAQNRKIEFAQAASASNPLFLTLSQQQ